MNKPSENLTGMTLSGEWKIVSKRKRSTNQTGGHFSTGYDVVGGNGRMYFLKAIDLSDALQSKDVLNAMSQLLESVNHEREILEECRSKKFNRIATMIHQETLPMGQKGFPVPVPCFIFDAADYDSREFLGLQKQLEVSRFLQILHTTALGLKDLHSIGIAHQDVKPSNVLVYPGGSIRIADLGRSSRSDKRTALDDQTIAGDLGYTPPELLYGRVLPDWRRRRLGTDLYMLGGLLAFFLTQQSVTSFVLSQLPKSFRPGRCDFDTVLPAWRHVFSQLLSRLELSFKPHLGDRIAGRLISIIEYLCEPNPELRGHPAERPKNLNQHDLRRFIAEFYFLSRRIDLKIIGIA